jgi:hypothetical protein
VDNPEGAILNGTTTLAVQSLPSMSLETFGRASMKDKTVAILESRMRDHIASLVRKYGGTPLHTGPTEATSVRPRLCLSDASLPPHCATFSAPRRSVVQAQGASNFIARYIPLFDGNARQRTLPLALFYHQCREDGCRARRPLHSRA